ncbi:MAG: hypothetical protein JRF45_00535 [Deltaproteobacteria bacterium]|nr:hypothetical protein [Deltaproteobacteria bacterium]MBW2155172.1 hypothetical protein [Deltaproteobacteria bacterium]MBW2324974.1 hypothetical protein [Deltaproteobacteria bacterium]
MKNLYTHNLNDALRKLRDDIPRIVDLLGLHRGKETDTWAHILDHKLLVRLSPDFPIMATICGGGSSGKSTLFNSIVGDRLSPVGGSAGLNRRVLVSAHGDILHRPDILPALFEPFGHRPARLENPQDLTLAGPPLYVLNDGVPRNLVLMDTPDFDTGAKGVYINRDVTRQALEASDILIYIFTNSNYNNRENTDFIAQMLTGIGIRKCFLIYRVYPSFSDEEVRGHAMTVAANLYGSDASHYVQGIYRTDEDNAVAVGQKFMTLRSIDEKNPSFMEALTAVDSGTIRLELLSSILKDVVIQADEILEYAKISNHELRLYLDTLQTAQSHCVQEALQHFPMDRVMKRFVEIWMETDPPYVKAMRKTGSLVERPFKVLVGTAKKVKQIFSDTEKQTPPADFVDRVEEDLLKAVNSIHSAAVHSDISVDAPLKDPVTRRMLETLEQIRAGEVLKDTERPYTEPGEEKGTLTFSVSAHPVVFQEQEKLRSMDWKSVLESILSRRDVIVELSHGIEMILKDLANGYRSKMGMWTKIRQMFAAFLNVVPATAAVTYIISTGDPVGAVGIKVKLTGLFGLHDLYALVAIPATTGLKKADQNQLEEMLGPIVQTWLNDKLKAVRDLFEQEVTGGIIRAATDTLDASNPLIHRIETRIDTCKKVMVS